MDLQHALGIAKKLQIKDIDHSHDLITENSEALQDVEITDEQSRSCHANLILLKNFHTIVKKLDQKTKSTLNELLKSGNLH